jgi:hypothetical protein
MRLTIAALLFGAAVANAGPRDDAHAEMAAALAGQADLHPVPAQLPTSRTAPQHGPSSHASANGQLHGEQGQANAIAHQAEAAANAAVGQQRAQDAKTRAQHLHPGK